MPVYSRWPSHEKTGKEVRFSKVNAPNVPPTPIRAPIGLAPRPAPLYAHAQSGRRAVSHPGRRSEPIPPRGVLPNRRVDGEVLRCTPRRFFPAALARRVLSLQVRWAKWLGQPPLFGQPWRGGFSQCGLFQGVQPARVGPALGNRREDVVLLHPRDERGAGCPPSPHVERHRTDTCQACLNNFQDTYSASGYAKAYATLPTGSMGIWLNEPVQMPPPGEFLPFVMYGSAHANLSDTLYVSGPAALLGSSPLYLTLNMNVHGIEPTPPYLYDRL